MRAGIFAALVLSAILFCGCSGRSGRTDSGATGSSQGTTSIPTDHAQNLKAKDLKWYRMAPEIGEDSPEITILHVDSTTHAMHLMIRVPSGFTVPEHWHSANETHTVVQGTFIMECEGVRDTLTAGSFNYIPKRMPHRAWTPDAEGTLLLITVDGPWDINFVGGPPVWSKLRSLTASRRKM